MAEVTYQPEIVNTDKADDIYDATAFLKAGSLTSNFSYHIEYTTTSDTITIDSIICNGDPFLLPDGNPYPYVLGLNQDTLQLAVGQDMITVFLNLEVVEIPATYVIITACEGEFIDVNGQVFNTSGQYQIPYPTAGPCDSIVYYTITFLPILQTFIEQITCREEDAGVETLLFVSINGCDSIVEINTILDTTYVIEEEISYEGCFGDTLLINGLSISRDTSWTEIFTAENGCDSLVLNQVSFSEVNFEVFQDITNQLCQGQDRQIIYGTDFGAVTESSFAENQVDSVALPDGTGGFYLSSIIIDDFPDGAVIESARELEICLNIEHSWMYDLGVFLECPDGTSIELQYQDFAGGEVFLGDPYVLDDNNPGPFPIAGIGYTYCWVANAPNGNWTTFALNQEPTPPGYTLPPGNYAPYESFDTLVGCPWNGEWRLTVEDLWLVDNGYVFDWTIRQRTSRVDTASIFSQGWLDQPDAIISGDTLSFLATEVGTYNFTYNMQNIDGCNYDTTFIVEVLPAYLEDRDTSLCLGSLLNGTMVDTAGTYPFHLTSINGCDSTINFQVNLLAPDTTYLFSESCLSSEAGTFIETFANSHGCDSLIVTEINYLAPADTTIEVRYNCTATQNDEYITLQSASGCDSIVLATYVYEPLNYNLIILPDTCLQGLGSLAIALLDNPNYSNIEISLFRINTANQVGEGTFITGLTEGFYSLQIMADAYCLSTETLMVPNVEASPPPTSFDFTATANTVNFVADSPATGSLLFWNFGDGVTGTGEEVSHEYPYYGLYETCLSSGNDCGESTTCDTVFLPFLLETAGGQGAQGEQLSLAVKTNGVYQLAGLNFTYKFASPEVVQLDSVTPIAFAGLGNFEYSILDSEDLLTINWEATENPGLTLESSDTLFLIHLTLTGEPGSATNVIEETAPYATFFLNGGFSTQYEIGFVDTLVSVSGEEAEISGLIQTAPYHTMPLTPMANVQVNLETGGQLSETSMTAADGLYDFMTEVGTPYRIYCEKEGDDLNGLSTLGILRLLRHLAGVLPFNSPYELIAADLDCNQAVNIADANRLQDLMLGNGMPLCNAWFFVPSDYDFPDPTNPFPFPQDYSIPSLEAAFLVPPFYGIKVGDVLGEAAPERPILGDTLILQVNNRTAVTGDTIEVAFQTNGFDLLTGFQLELQFDTMLMEWVDAEAMGNLTGYSSSSFGLNQIENGYFRNIWFAGDLQPASLEEGTVLFTIRLKAKADIEDGLEPHLAFFAENLAPEAYDANFERIDLLLQFDLLNATTEPSKSGALQLFQNQPNPFGQETLIPFFLPQGSEVELVITDAVGRLIERHVQYYAMGYHQYLFQPKGRLAPGLYYYSLYTPYGWASRKMLLLE